MKELYELMEIKHNLSTSHHPQTDGPTKRVNQEVKQYLRLFNYRMDDLAEWLTLAEFCYNKNCISSSTGNFPFFITKGREVNTGLDPTPKAQTPETPEEFAVRMKGIREETQATLKGAADDMKQFYDWKHLHEEYDVGIGFGRM